MTIEYTSDLTQGKIYSASSILSASYSAQCAFDNNDNTLWHSNNSGINWIMVDFAEPVAITKVVYRPETLYQASPILQASNDLLSWNSIYTLNGLSANATSIFTFINTLKYRYYRLIGNNNGYFNARTLEMMSNILSEYKTNGQYLSNILNVGYDSAKIFWSENKPSGTDVNIEYATGEVQGQWQGVLNGDVISINTNLWLRATLSTLDTSVTPTLQDLWLEDSDAPQDKILLTMDWWGRFNNVDDKIKVLYDASKGSLTGAGGAVESFEIEFTPQDLVQTPNPNEEELIKAYPYEIVLNLNELDFEKSYANEYLKAYPYAIVLTLTDIGEINP